MILNNFICANCAGIIGEQTTTQILSALNPDNLYADDIDRHPAKIASKLGFNLSLTKGIYKTRQEIFFENVNTAFSERLGSILAVGTLFLLAVTFGFETFFINED